LVIAPRNGERFTVDVDPALTMLSDQAGVRNATVVNGGLKVGGTAIETDRGRRRQDSTGKEN
jgi:hypothetical protein